MNAFLLVLWTLFVGSDLLRDEFDAGMATFHVTAGDGYVDGGMLVLKRGRVESSRTIFGDVAVEAAVNVDAGARLSLAFAEDSQVRLESKPAPRLVIASAGREQAGVLPEFPPESFLLRVVVRGGAIEASIDGRPFVDLVDEAPLGGGPIAIVVDDGAVRIDHVAVTRLDWRDAVEVDGVDPARVQSLAARPLEDFRLLDPSPSRIDAEYRVAVVGEEDAPIVVRTWGVRRSADEIPLLEQALALAGVRPYLSLKVTEIAEDGTDVRVVDGEGPFGPFAVKGAVRVEVDALLGVGDEWPALALYDVANDRFLDRVVPGGPAGRGLVAEVPEDVDHLTVELVVPGREKLTHDVRLIRS